jgi:chemotaxis protein CheC
MIRFTDGQLSTLTSLIRIGAEDASKAMSTWLERSISVEVETVKQIPLNLATDQLGTQDETVCACWMKVNGLINGQLFLVFDDQSGLSLCEKLLPSCTSAESWGELETSAAMETTNIVGCAFLNSLSCSLPQIYSVNDVTDDQPDFCCIPSTPVFLRDYAAAIMQSVLIDQAWQLDSVIVIKSDLWIADSPLPFHFMFVPDAESLELLARIIP